MNGSVKVLGGCYRNGKLRRVMIATDNPKLRKQWEKLFGQPIFNGWQRKIWRKRIVIGRIYFNGWGVEPNRSVSPECPCLEVCLFAGVLVKKLFGIKTGELRFPDDNYCSSCKTGMKEREIVFSNASSREAYQLLS